MDDVTDQYSPADVEAAVDAYWDDHDAYEATKEAHAEDPTFFFVDGPPYTSGQMHLGTAWNKTLKDAVIRQKRMTGHQVTDRPGYDMHGLPIEVKVEEKLGFDSKRDIEEFGMEAFIEECMEFAESNRVAMDDDFQSIGAWFDWDNPYKTVNPEYMEAAWHGFKQVADRDLVEQGKRSISQCPRCETGLANNEVEYDQVEDPSIYVKFPLADREGSLVIWTTTPWTIPGNTFVAVGEELTYNKVRATKGGDEEVLYVASECVDQVLGKGRYDDYEIEDELSGQDLVGWEYNHPLVDEVPEYPQFEGAGQVYTADYVEADRTGLVHSAPGHGEEDFHRGQELGLDVFCPVRGDGTFTEAGGKYEGAFVRDANDEIKADLDAAGALLASETYQHSYGHCWRCDTDIIQLVTDQWFISITDIKDELLDNIEDAEWHPEWARENRFRDFIENAPDWNVSRQRYWGIPIPIWVPEDALESDDGTLDEEMIVIGNREELADRVDQSIDPDEIDLHRPTVDDLTITEDGTTYRRIEDVFDVWLDSSVATWATLGYPGETEDFEELWPADLIIEAHDQTRGWFWSQLGMGTAAFGESPYKEVLMHGFANDKNGRKMSKSVGNIVTPEEAIERAGRDPLRAYLLSHDQQGVDLSFDWDGLGSMVGRLNICWNVFRFPLTYMDLDGYDPADPDLSEGELTTVDEWVLSRLQNVKQEATEAWDDYRVHDALNTVLDFITEDVSRFYVKATRERMWDDGDSASKLGAYATLATVQNEVIRLLAPFTPYMAEQMYQILDGSTTTVHALDWPEVDADLHKPDLETDMAVLRDVEEAAANARQRGGRKLRWPVSRIVVETDDETVASAVDNLADLLSERVNAREIEIVDEFGELEEFAEPQMGKIGPAFGADAQKVMSAVEGAARADVEAGIEVDGETIELDDEMVEYRSEPPEHVTGTDFEGGTVYVDTTLTEDLESEGYARDVIRRIQEMRKQLDLDVESEIRVGLTVDDERIEGFVDEHRDLIAEEVRAAEFVDDPEDAGDRVEDWEIEDVDVTIGVAVVAEQTV
ncbi:isoleucyl-tRNA synthetase [Halohasta litchfieldiae]|jgi:isoleucyl-tRNA synthetase|uniref:Isoleucine--tRNA ligase n=1 Tax=Halohasta litchfieldiae TaxID=1073996 RepID=A0A1H6SIH6_9EURY|nr:isoleucine--tRNA ligase [Halohasta litchfieldiae]ATW87853.1 isoleucyl-tRNA synthetase [Halohasta litchfieldiae]SEI63575.1 Isoleucyl-tRNA synthetase [Halohasta litchfieldiae]